MSVTKNKKSCDEDIQSRFHKQSTYDSANIFSRFWLWFTFPLFIRGLRNNGLELDDLYRCPVDDEVQKIMKELDRNWTKAQRKSDKPSFAWIMFSTNFKYYLVPISMFMFTECVVYIIQPLLLGRLIRHFNGDLTIDRSAAWAYAGGIVACLGVVFLVDHPMVQYTQRLGMRNRIAACALIYRKALRLSRAALGQTAIGQIVNIMSNDVNRFDEFCISGIYLIVSPIQAVIIGYIVWTYLGLASLVGVAVLLLFLPFQALMGRLFSTVREKTAILTDTRLRYMNEIIAGMRVIKMYCWERPFAARVAQARSSEVKQIRNSCHLRSVNLALYFVTTRIILFACFVTYMFLDGGQVLTAEAVFVSMALFNTLRLTLTYMFPMGITAGSELLVVCRRIEQFLLLEENEVPSDDELDAKISSQNKEPHLKVDHLTANWMKTQIQPTLSDISVDLKPGDLLTVIGPVGSGKSSFLMSLLKELPLVNGAIDQQGSLCYASQDAWTFPDSVRNNILFGEPYDEHRYRKVVKVCALSRDFSLLPLGDQTLVGEKGVTLSGGQKARVNLARAIYRQSDICLLDDPLSAVDSSVAEHIFQKCILGHLSDKITVLVTHQIQFVEKATKILVLKEGRCLTYGSFADIQNSGIDFVHLLAKNEEDGDDDGDQDKNNKQEKHKVRSKSVLSVTSKLDESIEQLDFEQEDKPIQMEEEHFQRGSIKGRIYMEYIRSGTGIFMFSAMLLFTGLSQGLFHGLDIFLTAWTNKNQKDLGGNDEIKPDAEEQRWDILVYTGLIVALFITTILRSMTFFAICMRASVRLHNHIFSRLLRVPVAFFDTNPVGRILNRFARDMGTIDEKFPYVAYDLNLNFTNIIGIVVTVSLVNWYLLLPAVFLSFVSYYVRKIYVKSARDIKRFEGLVRSPVYSHLSNTITGLASVRAFRAQDMFERQFYGYQNDHTATWFLFIATSRTMGIVMEAICSLYILVITLVVMLTPDMEGGSAGLAISTGLMLTGITQWGIRQSAEFENQMTSVERLVEYKELKQEAPAETGKQDLRKTMSQWPTDGGIEFDHMSLSYGTDEEEEKKPVLVDISCRIEGGEKIGIVGRTGAGKSSMIAALFRLTEPSGAIRIDGVDTKQIGLDDLRKKISIIPQDPVVFSGTVRYNLDPFNEYSDADLWSALDKVQLKLVVDTQLEGKLEAKLTDGGGNLSVGQRQLVCLARAILRRNRILVLDEATANVDHQTDALIQRTIRTEFAHCTVLTIAHRLNTIIDCDRVLVLDAGRIREFDSPQRLLANNEDGLFYEMCHKTGPVMFAHLTQMANSSDVPLQQF